MVTAPLRFCAEPGCPEKVTKGRCRTHERSKREQKREEDPSARLYGLYRTARWRRLRASKLLEDPFCAHCRTEGRRRPWDELDHVIPHKGDLQLFWDEGNLQGLCRKHHNAKTRQGL